MKIISRFFIVAGAMFSCATFAGPFGLEMGMTIDQIDKNAKQISSGKFKTDIVPKPHSSFEAYVLQFSSNTGLCYIKAVGKTFSVNSYGAELESVFTGLKDKLDTVYGKSKLLDALMPKSIWNEPNDWMMGLYKKERLLAAEWNTGTGAKLPEHLSTIVMMAHAMGTDKGWVSVDYKFNNHHSCEKEISAQEDDSL